MCFFTFVYVDNSLYVVFHYCSRLFRSILGTSFNVLSRILDSIHTNEDTDKVEELVED